MAEILREDAQHHRQAMEQRRNVEITLFGALITAQIALVALAASQVSRKSAHPTARFCGAAGIILFAVYVATVTMIEVQNKKNRDVYAPYEAGDNYESYGFCRNVVRSWAAWPVAAALPITALLVWTMVDFGW